jgi:hypothetical protein
LSSSMSMDHGPRHRWVMSHSSAIPLRAHPSETSLSTGTLGAYRQVAVPPCSWRCQLVP